MPTTTATVRSRDECDALIRLHRPLGFRVLSRLRRTAACVASLDRDDTLAAVLWGLWRAARVWDGVRPFSSLGWCCVTRQLFAVARRRRQDGMASLDELGLDPAAPMPREDRHEQASAGDLLQALALLPRDDREILTAIYHNGRTLVDVGAALGCTGEGIRKKKLRALASLRKTLGFSRPDAPPPDR